MLECVGDRGDVVCVRFLCCLHPGLQKTGGASIIPAERTREPFSQQDPLFNEGQQEGGDEME